MKKKLIFLIIFLLLIFFLIVIFTGKNPSQKTQIIPTPTPVQNNAPTLAPRRSFDAPGSTDKLLQKVENRQEIASGDAIIRKQLISSLGDKSGILFSTSSFVIEYVKSADVFMVEIRGREVIKSKEEATRWFEDKKISKEGICNLPIVFYLNSKVANEFKNVDLRFSPLPEGC